MSWSTLAIEAGFIKNREALLFSDMTDADVIAMYQDAAKDRLRSDLAEAMQVAFSDDTAIDGLATTNTAEIKRALAYMQMHLYFIDQDAGEGSVNRYKAKHYGQMYAGEQQRFKTFNNTQTRVATVTLSR